jgi:hypothetical protein
VNERSRVNRSRSTKVLINKWCVCVAPGLTRFHDFWLFVIRNESYDRLLHPARRKKSWQKNPVKIPGYGPAKSVRNSLTRPRKNFYAPVKENRVLHFGKQHPHCKFKLGDKTQGTVGCWKTVLCRILDPVCSVD